MRFLLVAFICLVVRPFGAAHPSLCLTASGAMSRFPACSPASRKEQYHAAPWENPRAGKYPVSHHTNDCDENGAHGGLLECAISVARVGAGTPALMTDASNQSASGVHGSVSLCDSRLKPAGEVAQSGSAPSESSEVARSNRALAAHPKTATYDGAAPAGLLSIRSSGTSATEVRADHSAVSENARERATNFREAA